MSFGGGSRGGRSGRGVWEIVVGNGLGRRAARTRWWVEWRLVLVGEAGDTRGGYELRADRLVDAGR